MAEIQLRSGEIAIVDDCDAHLLLDFQWMYRRGCRVSYVWRAPLSGSKKREQYLHRVIAGAMPGQIIDHVNGNTLDNRRENLRIVTSIESARNRRKTAAPTSSIYKGVNFDARSKVRPWRASIRIGYGKRKHLGQFSTEKEAALAYDAASRQFHGEFGSRNFV